jgi:hypothetical protein
MPDDYEATDEREWENLRLLFLADQWEQREHDEPGWRDNAVRLRHVVLVRRRPRKEAGK